MEDCKDNDILSVTTTVASRADALRLARRLVDERLAACVQVEPAMTSVYRWQGAVCEESELRLVIKLPPERLQALQVFMQAHHPYEVPQFLAQRMTASAAYAAWAREQTLR